MREVNVTTQTYDTVWITVGVVDQNGKYETMIVSKAEAAVLAEN